MDGLARALGAPELQARIEELLRRRGEGSAPPHWPELTSLLTDGLADVLVLEAERHRLEREIDGLASGPFPKSSATRIAELTRRRTVVDIELRSLRSALAELRSLGRRASPAF
jgi:hypothetical protein